MSFHRPPKPTRIPWWAKPWLILVILPAIALAVIVADVLAIAATPKADPEAEVRAVLDAQAEACNRGDLDGFMAGYWESEELRFASGGTVTTGFAATKGRYVRRYKAEGKAMGHLTFSEVTVEVLTTEVALVRGRWRLTFEKGEAEPHGLYTLTVKKLPEGWRVTSDHTSAAERE